MARTAKSRAFASVAKAHHARTRANLVRQAERERAKAEALEVSTGVDETVALAEGRGEAFERPKQRPGERAKPVRRLNGVALLVSRGVLSTELAAVANAWGDLWRQGYGDTSLRSCIAADAIGGSGDPTGTALEAARRRVQAQARLRSMSGDVQNVPALYGALTAICGVGLTCRQYGLTDKGALVVQTNLIAALELMRAGVRRAA
jgi:hypothetical protein